MAANFSAFNRTSVAAMTGGQRGLREVVKFAHEEGISPASSGISVLFEAMWKNSSGVANRKCRGASRWLSTARFSISFWLGVQRSVPYRAMHNVTGGKAVKPFKM